MILFLISCCSWRLDFCTLRTILSKLSFFSFTKLLRLLIRHICWILWEPTFDGKAFVSPVYGHCPMSQRSCLSSASLAYEQIYSAFARRHWTSGSLALSMLTSRIHIGLCFVGREYGYLFQLSGAPRIVCFFFSSLRCCLLMSVRPRLVVRTATPLHRPKIVPQLVHASQLFIAIPFIVCWSLIVCRNNLFSCSSLGVSASHAALPGTQSRVTLCILGLPRLLQPGDLVFLLV